LLYFCILAALLTLPMLVLAQEEEPELICEAFPDSSADIRTSYYMGEGAAFFSSGQLVRAIDSFSCVIEQINGDYIDAYTSRAIVYTARRDYEEAIEDYTRAIELDANLLAAHNNRGIVYVAIVEYENALADFNKVLDLDSSNVLALNNRGIVHAINGDYDLAIADFQQAIELSNIDNVVATLTDPNRTSDAPRPEYNLDDAQSYALLGIVYSAQALDNYNNYLLLTGSQGDARVQSAAGALESRFTFDLRLDDGTWLLTADFTVGDE
jgi:tetratricopeptide (TPR) repeat protein